MSPWDFNQSSSASRRTAMISGHMLPRLHVPESDDYEDVQHERPVHPMMVHHSTINNGDAHQALPSVSTFFEIADNQHLPYYPTAMSESGEDTQYIVMASPPPTPITPMNLGSDRRGVKNSSESPLFVPVSSNRNAKRQKLGMTPEDIEADLEIEAKAEIFLQEQKGKASAGKAVESPTPHKKVIPYACDSKTRHNVSQSHLRGEKGCHRLVTQRILYSNGFSSDRIQTKKNAMSSGLICEETTLQMANNSLASLAMVLLRMFCEGKTPIAKIMAMLPEFRPDEIRPKDGSKEAKLDVMLEAHESYKWEDMRSEEDVRRVMGDLRSLVNPIGKRAIDNFMAQMSESASAKL